MSRLIIGLTGGIGSGKTTVSDLFATKGIDIVDADVIARELVAKGSEALAKIEQKFGPQALTEQGELDRAYLRQRVFKAPEEKQWLDDLLHPMVRQQMLLQCQQAQSTYCILSVPLLVENQLLHMVERVLVVDVEEERQLNRASARDNNSRQQIKTIMQAQASRQQRLEFADDIVNNNGSVEALPPQIEHLHQQYLHLAGQISPD